MGKLACSRPRICSSICRRNASGANAAVMSCSIPSACVAEPALFRDVENDTVGILELALEIHVVLGLAEIEKELAARRLDAALRPPGIFRLEAQMMAADPLLEVVDAGRRGGFILQQRQVDDAVGEID